ncbi:efflux RND transporter permease subunit [Roseibium sediminicola]|uniref:Efflux RND transporter permease subunit n=1 Tax=Roseibium sediminicola TaxID=2933272 RepID=A0ABT0GMP5_9HYPH|nr:efflux RND transporter permease subunit [Roseibium sp. CAU 1639]MCK7610697.1 efflux RND transporter permease subunit [Roseibium sp. CAU 1639]
MIRYFASHPTAANLLMAGLIILGLLNLSGLLMETFPQIPIKKITVNVAYPGATSADVERTVCRRIEDALDGIENIDELKCDSRENLALATVKIVEGKDIDQLMLDVDREINAISDFPDGVEDPVIEEAGQLSDATSVVITGIDDKPQLKNYAEAVKERMLQFGGIPQVEVSGFSDRQFRIEVRDAAARELGLTLSEIADTLTRQNINAPSGEITTVGGSILLRFADERLAADAYASVIVASSAQGGQITLGDIATITDLFEDEEVETRLNGRLAAVLDISMTRSDDLIQVVERVKAFVAEEQARAAPGIDLTIINDGSIALKDRLWMLVNNSGQGLLLVVAAMWIFFGGRQAFWIGMGLPVSFLGALAIMSLFGLTINMLSMVALLIVVGIMMDDAIVISENIATKRHQGLNALEAAVQGTLQVAPGVFASFLTTAAIFGALAFISGDLGDLLRVIPIVMLLVLVISLIEAFLILPNHLSHAAKDEPNLITRKAEAAVSFAREHIVGPCATWSVRNRYFTVGICIMLFLSTLALIAGGLVKFQAFPNVEGDQIEARIELPASATLQDTRTVVAETIAALERMDAALAPRNPDGASLLKNVLVRFNENSDAGTNGAHLATLNIDLLEGAARDVGNQEILTVWRRELPETLDVRRVIITESSVGPAGRAIELRLAHPDPAVLDTASEELQTWLNGYQGVYNISDDLSLGKPELALSLKDGAGAVGLDAKEIADQLKGAYNGITADEVQVGSESFEVDVRLAGSDRNSLGDLELFTIETPSGHRVPLGTVANILSDRSYTRINRIDRVPTVTITGDVLLGVANANEVVSDTEKNFLPGLLERYPGLTASTEGQNAEGAKTQASMAAALGTGLIFVFILLSFQFRSYTEPVVVMVLIPLAMIGAVWGHLLMGIDFALPSMLGFISLAGVVVNDSILLVEFIKDEHAPDMENVADIAPLGAKARFRAILLTSVTTIAGMLPLLFETSPQAQVLIPLVTSISFGLIGTTLMIVFVVPAFYTILDDFGLTSLARERRAHREAVAAE